MADPLSMSLEDLIKKNTKGSSRGGRGGRGRGRGGSGGRASGSSSTSSMEVERARGPGPIRRGRRQQQAQRSSPYKSETGGNSEAQWSHDLYNDADEEEEDDAVEIEVAPRQQQRQRARRESGRTGAGASAGGKPRGITLGHSLALTNVPYSMKEADLEDLFSPIGELRSTEIIIDGATGRPTGFAKVVFCRLGDANAAVEQYDQQLIEGRRVTVVLGDFEEVEVEPSEPAPRRERRPRGGAGGASSGGHWRGGSGRASSSTSTSTSESRPEWLQHDVR